MSDTLQYIPYGTRVQRIIAAVSAFAEAEARRAQLPGWTNGPADAYRHLLVVGELTRRLGPIPAASIAEVNETISWYQMQRARINGRPIHPSNRPESRAMDRHNNWRVAPVIGRVAQTPEDVIQGSRDAIERAIPLAGSGESNTAYLRPMREWHNDRESGNWPRPGWQEVFGQPHVVEYRRQAGLSQQPEPPMRPVPPPPELPESGGGPVHVRPHQRDGHPVQGHQRSAPSR